MTFPADGDEVIYQAYLDYQEMCGPDGEDRYPHYWSYVQDQVENYRQLMREEPCEENQQFLDKLEAEVLRHIELEHGQQKDAQKIIQQQAMRPQAYDPDGGPPDGEERGVTVNVRLWIGDWIEAPVTVVRDLLSEYDGTTWLTIEEVWMDDPE